MAWHSVTDAQKLTGKSRRTLYRDMAEGRITWEVRDNNRRYIETSELLRVYGSLKDVAQPEPEKVAHSGTPQNDAVLAELKALRAEVRELRETLQLIEHKPQEPDTKTPPWWRRFFWR